MEMVEESLNRFDVWLVLKNPEKGRVVENLGLCAIISPDELNALPNRIVAPMTTKCEKLPSRIECNFDNSKGYIMLDQMRVIDKLCFVRKLGSLDLAVHAKLCDCLQEFFAL
ncbi:MAG: type II toxin-antitoxin system PemK/MazF family toxin [Gammaproteobacteria bacterium]